MCRISAVIGYNHELLEEKAKVMAVSMAHGGPDDQGVYINKELSFALSHRRLSIIDLSSLGHQPMANDTGDVQIIFNGEIYNYVEIRNQLLAKGVKFRSHSDTEVLIYGYIHWGIEELLKKVKGMFSFIIADIDKRLLVAARDQNGIKPLYYSKHAGYFYFASEVRAFKAVNNNWPTNSKWNIWFLTYGFIPEPFTTLEDVFALEKGHYLIYDLTNHTYNIKQYYSHNYDTIDVSYREALDNVKSLFEQSIERHLVADVPVGIFLSGGLDSSLITYVAKQFHQDPIHSLSIYFDDKKYSEQKFQDIVAKETNVIHNTYKVDFNEFSQSWSDIAMSLDQPSIDAINSYFICKYAKKNNLKVVLSGLGADEFFGGYPSFNRTQYYKRFRNVAQLQNIVPVFNNYPRKKLEFLTKNTQASEYLFYRGLFTPSDVSNILDISKKEVWDELSKFKINFDTSKLDPKNRVSLYESSIYMQSQLLKDSDVQSMWHSIELRVPFLDIDLVSYVNKLPTAIKYKDDRQKPLLIDAFRDILPEAIWNRPKQGFTFPFDTWFKKVDVFNNEQLIDKYYSDKFKKGDINFTRIWAIYLANTFGSGSDFINTSIREKPDLLFTYLVAFNKTGGIEKVNRTILKCLSNIDDSLFAEAWSLYDNHNDTNYFPQYLFKGFNQDKLKYVINLIKNNKKWDKIIVGHINLAPIIRIMKVINPKLKVILMAHGIEVWDGLNSSKNWLLRNADKIVAVSNHTKNRIVKESNISTERIEVLSNCLDPFFPKEFNDKKPAYLLDRYKIGSHTKIILTITRLNSQEGYKGYNRVIEALDKIANEDRTINYKYLLCGSYDQQEFERINTLIVERNLKGKVVLTGFIAESELIDHYNLADVFIMPSSQEGFGIVYIEAAASGLQVIAGNADGSAEALMNGKIGHLVNPESIEEIFAKLLEVLKSPISKSKELAEFTLQQYGFNEYKDRFLNIVKSV